MADSRALAQGVVAGVAVCLQKSFEISDNCLGHRAGTAGVVVENPLNGEPLDAPLDTTTPVAWAAYANPRLARHIRPALQRLIREML